MFEVGDTVVVNVPYKNLLDGMSRYNGHTAIISGLPRIGWYTLDGAAYLEFREDWLSSSDKEPKFKFAVGDEVVVRIPAFADSHPMAHMVRFDGYVGTVEAFWKPRTYALSGTEMAFDEDWLSLIDEEPSLHVPGAKDDADKPPVDLLYSSFPRALLELARVAGDGAKKYTKDGWVHVEDGEYRYANAAGRHALKRWIDGEKDPESGHRHLAHQAWNILAVLELGLRNEETSTKTS
jgi:hypothetical protein